MLAWWRHRACTKAALVTMWKLLTDLAALYCSAASWALAAGERTKACELVEKAEACLQQRKRQSDGEAEPRWLITGN